MSLPVCCSPEKSMENSRLQAQRSNESPSGAFKRRSGLAQQDGGALPRQVPPRCTECRQCKEKHGFPAGMQKVCRAPENGKSHEESYDSSWDFGALEGTRIPGPLIKSQMLYRLSYERIFCGKTIPPNNITTIGCKKQERHLKKRKIRLYTTKLLKKPLRPALQQLHQQAGIDADHRGRLAQIHGLALGQVG